MERIVLHSVNQNADHMYGLPLSTADVHLCFSMCKSIQAIFHDSCYKHGITLNLNIFMKKNNNTLFILRILLMCLISLIPRFMVVED